MKQAVHGLLGRHVARRAGHTLQRSRLQPNTRFVAISTPSTASALAMAQHTAPSSVIDIQRLPVLNDNYVWLLHDQVSQLTAVVDPAEAAPVQAALRAR
jgi:hypothetical protein